MAISRTNARFAKVLLEARLIDELQVRSVMAHVDRWGGSLPRAIEELGFADEDTVVDALAKSLRVPAMHLGNVLKDNGALRALGVDFCETNTVFPVSLKDRVLTLAMADPTELQVVDDASSMAGARVKVMMAAETEIRTAIAKHFRGQDLPQRRKVSNVRRAPSEEAEQKFDADLSPIAPAAPAPPRFTPEEVQRLQAALENQQKVGHIVRTVESLLAEKGLLPRG